EHLARRADDSPRGAPQALGEEVELLLEPTWGLRDNQWGSEVGAQDRVGWPADGRAVFVQHGVLARDLLRRGGPGRAVPFDVARVGVPRDQAQRPALTPTADQDRHALLDRPGRHPGVGDPQVLAREGHPLLSPEPREELEGLLQGVQAVLRRWQVETHLRELVAVPAAAEAQDQATVAQAVDVGGDPRQEHRVAELDAGDEGAQPDAPGRPAHPP